MPKTVKKASPKKTAPQKKATIAKTKAIKKVVVKATKKASSAPYFKKIRMFRD